MLGVACWHLLRGRNVEVFRSAAKLAIVVALPVTLVQLGVGSEFGVAVTDAQPMKIAATEALWDTEQPAGFSLFQIGGFTEDDQTPSFDIEIPGLLSFLATNSFDGQVVGINELQRQYERQYGRGQLHPRRAPRLLEHARDGLPGDAVVPARALGRLAPPAQEPRGRQVVPARPRSPAIALPFLANFAGWILTEAGRQPWVVYGLLKTEDAVSSTVSTWTVGLSLGVFVSLYAVLGAVDFYLMRRYARLDPPEVGREDEEEAPRPAPAY